MDMTALVNWLHDTIDQAQRDTESGQWRSITTGELERLPASAIRVMANKCIRDRQHVENVSVPMPRWDDPDGVELQRLAREYRLHPGFSPAWLGTEPEPAG